MQVTLSEQMATDSGILEFAPFDDVVNAIRIRVARKSRSSYARESPATEMVNLVFTHKSEFETLVNFHVTLERVGDDNLSWNVISINPVTRRITMR